MKNISLIEDRKNGQIFGAIVFSKNGLTAYGSTGQGAAWAKWVNEEKISIEEIEDGLEASLVISKPKIQKNINLEQLSTSFNKETIESFKAQLEIKELIRFIETKSEPENTPIETLAYEMEHLYAEEESISNWPITDVSLASIDVAFKMNAVAYKAKAFHLDRKTSSMLIQIKGLRAVWDPDMPGGGGYRCPDDTPNGGQYTNRVGAGCTFGIMRRIGTGLVSASLRDITKPIDDPVNQGRQRALYNLGRSMELRGARRQQELQEKFRRRVERRVAALKKKENKRNGAPSFSEIYGSLNPEMARRDRIRIAAGNAMSRMGQDIANAGHIKSQSRRLKRISKQTDSAPDVTANVDATDGQVDGTNDKRSSVASKLREIADQIANPGTRRQARRQRNQNAQTSGGASQPAPQAQTPSTAKQPKRSKRGKNPQTGSLAERFRKNQVERLRRRTVKKRRTAKGRRPRPTDSRVQRAQLRLRRRANRLNEVADSIDDFPQYSRGLPDPNKGLEGLIRRNGASQSDIPESFRIDEATVDSIRRNYPEIDGAFTGTPDKSNGLFEAIEFVDRRSREGNGIEGLIPSVEQFDVDYTRRLDEALDEQAAIISDVMQEDRLNGTSRLRSAILGPNNQTWHFVDGVLIAVDDPANSIFHQFTPDGKNHLFSVLSDNSTPSRTDILVAGDYLRDKILGKKQRRSMRERIASRRRVFSPGSPAASSVVPSGGPSLRARSRAVIKDKANPGLQFGKTTTGPKLLPSYSQADIDKMLTESGLQLDAHLDRWRRRLGITDLSLPIDELDVQKYLATLNSTDPRRAAMNATDWHNTLILSNVVDTGNWNELDLLKPQTRMTLLTRAGVPYDTTVSLTKSRPVGPTTLPPPPPAAPPTPGGGVSPVPSAPPSSPAAPAAPSAPSAPTAPSAPAAPSAPTAPSAPAAPSAPPSAPAAPPAPSSPPSPTVLPTSTTAPAFSPIPTVDPNLGAILITTEQTGVDIIPEVGNPANGIVYDSNLKMYFDTTTGESVEDLSGLKIDEVTIVSPMPLDDSSIDFPSWGAEGSLERFIVAPGVDPVKFGTKIKKPNPNAKTAVTVGLYKTFAQALGVLREYTGPKRMTGRRSSNRGTFLRLDLSTMPMLDGTMQYREVMAQALQQFEASGEVFGPQARMMDDVREKISIIDRALSANDLTILNELGVNDGLSLQTAIEYFSDFRDISTWLDNNGLSFSMVSGSTSPLTHSPIVYLSTSRYNSVIGDIPTKELNRALQAEAKYKNEYIRQSNDPSLSDPGKLSLLRQDAADKWVTASRLLVDTYTSAAAARDRALTTYRAPNPSGKPSRTKTSRDSYLINGVQAELAKALLDLEVFNNPFAMSAQAESTRFKMQNRAQNFNRRRRAVSARLARAGRRNTGLYDNDPDVLDPWSSSTPPLDARTPDVISTLVRTHKSEGIYDDPRQGIYTIDDEQILMLSQMAEIFDAGRTNNFRGPSGTDIENKEFEDIGQAQLATTWYYNGWDALPVLINEDETRLILSEVDSDGDPKAVAITRGVKGTVSEQIQFTNDALRGDRFIPGTGGSAAGRGEYFTSSPVHWSSYHGGQGGTVIGVVTKDQKIISKGGFEKAIQHKLLPITRELFDIFGQPTSGSQGGSRTTDKLFSATLIAQNPTTGLFDQAELTKLGQEIDALFTEGPNQVDGFGSDNSGWGLGTLEASLDIPNQTTTLPTNFGKHVFPQHSSNPSVTVEELQEAAEQRRFYNKWAHQHARWMLQLAQMHRDETSDPTAAVYNRSLQKAMRMLTFLGETDRAAIMGIDALFIDTNRTSGESVDDFFTPNQAWRGGYRKTGTGISNGGASRYLVLNRSGMIYFNMPVQHYTDWRTILSSIVYPDGTTALRPGMGW